MASLPHLSVSHWFPNFSNKKGLHNINNTKSIITCNNTSQEQQQQEQQQQQHPLFHIGNEESRKRRQVVLQLGFAVVSFPSFASLAFAENENFRVYTDDANKFKISIPLDWQVGSGEPNGYKTITAFYPEEASAVSNVSVVITGLGPDYTKMESFGNVDAFADTLVSGLDRSWQKPPGVKAKLINSKASKGFYYIEYTLQNPGESRRHLYAAIGMATTGWYNQLYTVTGQVIDEEFEKYSSKVEKVVRSFAFV